MAATSGSKASVDIISNKYESLRPGDPDSTSQNNNISHHEFLMLDWIQT